MSKNENLTALIDKAIAGDRDSLETVILSVRDLIFNLSLRMLGTFHDAEDTTQDIILKVITHLSSFKQKSSFSTWVFRIATNHLINYKKHMFAQYPLSFEFYGDDIENAPVRDIPDLTQDVEKALGFKNAMEEIDDLSTHFTFSGLYESPEQIKRFLTEFLESTTLSTVKNA